MALLSVGTAFVSWAAAVAGAALMLVGATLALTGGVLYDAVSALSIKAELGSVIAGDAHGGTSAGEMDDDAGRRRRALDTGERTGALLEESRAAPSPGLAPAVGWTLVVLAVLVVTSQWDWVARTPTGRTTSSRDTVLAVLLALCGIRLGIARGQHRFAATVAFLAATGLVLAGVLAAHDGSAAPMVELLTGLLGLAGAVVAWVSPWTDA